MNKTITSALIGTTMLAGGTLTADQMQNPYETKGTHYELSVASDTPQGDKVEVSKDEPKLTVSRWNDEARITIEPIFHGTGKVSKANRPLMSKKMEYKKGDMTAFIEPKAGSDSEFDIDFTLDSKPASNVFEYKIIGAEEYDFFYQSETLSNEEINMGAVRPNNVKGSYAVYHKIKRDHEVGKTNYGTGKIMHIYRPKAIDADGNEVWAVLDYSGGILSVTVPQEFLESASYPVVVDPTFGYTTLGASDFTRVARSDSGQEQTRRIGVTSTPAGAGTVTQISIGLRNAGGSDTVTATAFLNTENTGTNSHSQLGAVEADINTTTTATFFDFSASISVTAVPIIIGVAVDWEDMTTGRVMWNIYDSTPGASRNKYTEQFFGAGAYASSKESPWTAAGGANTFEYSIYATYSTGGGGGSPNISNDLIIFE